MKFQEEARSACAAEGKDYDRERMRHIGADKAEATERRKRRQRENADAGFSTWEEATARKYNKLVKGIKPDMERYVRLVMHMYFTLLNILHVVAKIADTCS